MGFFSRVKSYFTKKTDYGGDAGTGFTSTGYTSPFTSEAQSGSTSTSGGGTSSGTSGGYSGGSTQPAGTTPTEQALQQSLPADLRHKTVAQVQGRTLQTQLKERSRVQVGYERIKNYPGSIIADQERKDEIRRKAGQELIDRKLGFGVSVFQSTGSLKSFPEGTRFGGQSTPEGEVITIIPSEDLLRETRQAGKKAVKEQRTKKDFFWRDVPIGLQKIGFEVIGSEGYLNKALGIKDIKPTKLESAVKGYEIGVLPKVTANVILFGRGGYSLGKGLIKGTGSVARSLRAGEGFAAFKPSPQTSEALGAFALKISPIQPKSPNLFRTVSFSSKSVVKTTGIKGGSVTQETILGKYPDIPGSKIRGRRILIEGESGDIAGFSVLETSVPETKFTLKGLELGRRSEVSTSFQFSPSEDFAIQSISKKDFLLIGKETPLTGRTVSSFTRPTISTREFGRVVEISKSSDVIFEKTISGGVVVSRKETPLGTVEKSLGISGPQFGESAIGLKRDVSITKILKSPESPEFISGVRSSTKQKDILPKSNLGQMKKLKDFQATINIPKVSGSLPAPRYGASLARGETLQKQLSKVIPASRSASAVLLSSKQFQRFFSPQRSQQASAVAQIQMPPQRFFQPTVSLTSLRQVARQVSVPRSSFTPSINIPNIKAGFLLPPAFLPRLGKGGVPGAPSQQGSQPTRYQPTFSAAALGIKSFKVPKAYFKGAGSIIQRPLIQKRGKKKK